MATAKSETTASTEEAVAPVGLPPYPPALQETIYMEPTRKVPPPFHTDAEAQAYGLTGKLPDDVEA